MADDDATAADGQTPAPKPRRSRTPKGSTAHAAQSSPAPDAPVNEDKRAAKRRTRKAAEGHVDATPASPRPRSKPPRKAASEVGTAKKETQVSTGVRGGLVAGALAVVGGVAATLLVRSRKRDTTAVPTGPSDAALTTVPANEEVVESGAVPLAADVTTTSPRPAFDTLPHGGESPASS